MQNDMIGTVITGVLGLYIFMILVVYFISLRSYIGSSSFLLGSQAMIIIANVLALAVYLLMTQIRTASLPLYIAGGVGLALGLLAGDMSRVFIYKNQVEIKRSSIAPALLMIAYVSSGVFNFFGGKNLMSLGVLLVTAATAAIIGSTIIETFKGIRQENIMRRGPSAITEGETGPTAVRLKI